MTLATSLPFVGGVIRSGVTVLGLGLLVLYVRDVIFDDKPAEV